MMKPDVNVRLIDFPVKGKEMVIPNEDDSYTILINARLSYEAQLQAYAHALGHIQSGDFQKADVQEIEAVAHETEKSEPISDDTKEDKEWKKKVEKQLRKSRRRGKKLRRQLEERQKTIEFLLQFESEDFLSASLEHARLYDDL